MRKLAGIAALTALVLALVAGVAVTSAAPEKRGSKTVRVDDDFFSPSSLTVSKGTTVKFKWVGDDKHNVVKTDGPGGSFSSPTTASHGVNLSHKFSKTGKYTIICTIHEGMTMKLKVKN